MIHPLLRSFFTIPYEKVFSNNYLSINLFQMFMSSFFRITKIFFGGFKNYLYICFEQRDAKWIPTIL
jgi:hypothetical protein